MNLNSDGIVMESATGPHPTAEDTAHGPRRVLLIDATGFVGSRISRALRARTDTVVSILARPGKGLLPPISATFIAGDLTDPESLAAATKDIDVVINAASYVGSDPSLTQRINLDGALSVLRACHGSLVSRFIQLSTTALYGTGPHRGVLPWGGAPCRPASAASRSRAQADQAVLAAGGIAVRLNLIHGGGDRWFIQGVIRMIRTLGTTIGNGNSRISVVDVEDLEPLVAALATSPEPVSGAFYAANPMPVGLDELLREISAHITHLDTRTSSTLHDA